MSGLIKFDSNFDSGLCLYLTKKPKKTIEFIYEDTLIKADSFHQFITCEFNGANCKEDAYLKGYSSIQKALDIMCLDGIATLLTEKSEEEYFAWWHRDGERRIFHHVTISQPMEIGSPEVTVYDKEGNLKPSIKLKKEYHQSFRYYRLSQASDDIYDAYRNMYLAFEVLVSNAIPFDRKDYTEKSWIRAFLEQNYSLLQLSFYEKSDQEECVNRLAHEIYTLGRLPLFHAKEGKTVFLPAHDFDEKIKISKALVKLSDIVLRTAKNKFNVGRHGASINHNWVNKVYHELFQGTSLVVSDDIFDKSNKRVINRLADSIVKVIVTEADEMEVFLTSQCILNGAQSLKTFYIISDDGSIQMSWSPDVALDISDFYSIEVRVVYRSFLLNNPKRFYAR